jgi:hypothetical protein
MSFFKFPKKNLTKSKKGNAMSDGTKIKEAFDNLPSFANFITVSSIGSTYAWAERPVLNKSIRYGICFFSSEGESKCLAILSNKISYCLEKIYSADTSGMHELLTDLNEH